MTFDINTLMEIRDANETDKAFVLATWLRGLHGGNSWYNLIPRPLFLNVYHRVLEALLVKPALKVKIACLKEDPSVILGYAVIEHDRLHWVYVKMAWRKIGIAKKLVPCAIKEVSHLTNIGKSIFTKRKNLIFNPFSLL